MYLQRPLKQNDWSGAPGQHFVEESRLFGSEVHLAPEILKKRRLQQWTTLTTPIMTDFSTWQWKLRCCEKVQIERMFPTLQHSISLFAFSNHNSIYRNKWSFSWLPNQLVGGQSLVPPTFLSRCFVTYPPGLAKVLVLWLDVAPPAKMRIQVHRIHDLNFCTNFNFSD